ncbi:hypothetical protein BH09PAT1_BH09PAT1_2880 [soil metagenome]
MDDTKKKSVDEDTKVIGREQHNENKNEVHIPTSEDTIRLKSPSVTGESSVSGSDPDPESDDDTLLNAHAVGLQLGEDLEHPKPLDLGGDINKAEEYIKDH